MEKEINKIKTITKRYISRIYPEVPMNGLLPNLALWGCPVDLIKTVPNFWQSVQGRVSILYGSKFDLST